MIARTAGTPILWTTRHLCGCKAQDAAAPDAILIAVAAELVLKSGLPYRCTAAFRFAGPGASVEHR